MILNNESAGILADYLLQIKAIKLQPKNPFKWASGILSPIYCDNRVILSYPKIRTYVRQEIAKLVEKELPTPNVIVGVATGGIAIGALVAEELGLPFAYVRAAGKGHGMKNQIEGVVNPGQNALVIEDLISTGGSSLNAVKILREADCKVTHMVAIFTYGFDISEEAFKNENVSLITLSDYSILLDRALHADYINDEELVLLNEWRSNPKLWEKV
ncbi:MAG: orotate phosphoribosyltransferase [Patiriisocius sp.]|jgi:orotate phosphoribosyltransferase